MENGGTEEERRATDGRSGKGDDNRAIDACVRAAENGTTRSRHAGIGTKHATSVEGSDI